jgi:hypothetical protein
LPVLPVQLPTVQSLLGNSLIFSSNAWRTRSVSIHHRRLPFAICSPAESSPCRCQVSCKQQLMRAISSTPQHLELLLLVCFSWFPLSNSCSLESINSARADEAIMRFAIAKNDHELQHFILTSDQTIITEMYCLQPLLAFVILNRIFFDTATPACLRLVLTPLCKRRKPQT